MSKIGYKVIVVPTSVEVHFEDGTVKIKGSKGELFYELPKSLNVRIEGCNLSLQRLDEDRRVKALHGLYRSLIANAVDGVEKPWEKKMEIVGTGYNVKMDGNTLVFKLGLSHLVNFNPVNGINFKVEGNNKVIISGVDKQKVGEIANKIKMLKKPDPYKGKGIRYEGEVIKLKPGKKAKA